MHDQDLSPAERRRLPFSPRILAVLAALVIAGLVVTVVQLTRSTAEKPSPPTSTAPQPPPYLAIPGCYNHTVPPAGRPDKLNVVGCASVAVALQNMTWRSWGPQEADGTGTAVFKICDPNCAAGYQVTDRVVVHAWNPQPARPDSTCPDGLKIFADMILAFPEQVPPPTAEKMNTQYQGMPAVHLTNYSGDAPDRQFIGNTFCN
ncbi:hypothetical protein Mkiyose1665_27280 [Mycobacterium kiyosense]|nr:hypothetical protein IWGMT90018_23130 [Mycobacterium kiyosense]BDE14840.1 hypothetical protein MKCMC460_37000 [Mycobacterium sp. 20KCMC460]GLB98899.1 hypothetical protein SRL2020226_56750 [Mycobacterium kiyosense]GLC01486.1 hypothetical protein SRL2020400_20770 [Mycobacterium kiyosense]GLD17311.1 hypothetical protein Mkiyose1385_14100 [Mycobacterium kiyosense]